MAKQTLSSLIKAEASSACQAWHQKLRLENPKLMEEIDGEIEKHSATVNQMAIARAIVKFAGLKVTPKVACEYIRGLVRNGKKTS